MDQIFSQTRETELMTPEIIGDLLNAKVLIDRDSRSIIIAHEDMPSIKFSIDHPSIQGTKLERDARAAMDAKTIG